MSQASLVCFTQVWRFMMRSIESCRKFSSLKFPISLRACCVGLWRIWRVYSFFLLFLQSGAIEKIPLLQYLHQTSEREVFVAWTWMESALERAQHLLITTYHMSLRTQFSGCFLSGTQRVVNWDGGVVYWIEEWLQVISKQLPAYICNPCRRKSFEKIVYDQLYHYQSGFCSFHGTLTALLLNGVILLIWRRPLTLLTTELFETNLLNKPRCLEMV